MKWYKLTKVEWLIAAITAIVITGFGVYTMVTAPIGLADPKPELPPLEKNRVHHPMGFSIIAPEGWQALIKTAGEDGLNKIYIEPPIDARWYPKLIVELYDGEKSPGYTMPESQYLPGTYLEYDAMIYEGMWADYHGWHAMFSCQGQRYGVLLMLPHGDGGLRYDQVPDYWQPFLQSLTIKDNHQDHG